MSDIITPNEQQDDQQHNIHTNRPQQLSEFIGQAHAVQQITTLVQTAKRRNETAEHILIAGPPGLGKTTLANLVAQEQESQIHIILAQSISKSIDLITILMRLNERDVLFIDEIHRLPKHIAEILYPAMEDHQIHLTSTDENDQVATHTIPLKPFTLVGATTRPGMLPTPLQDRFGLTIILQFYPIDDLARIIERDANIMQISGDQNTWNTIAEASRGTPRIAKRLLRRVRDYAQAQHITHITPDIVRATLQSLAIHNDGLTQLDIQYLQLLARNGGGPLGIKTIASSLFQSVELLEVNNEPILLLRNLIIITPRGRQLTTAGAQYIRQQSTTN